jgi:hypothetical protein
MTARTWGELEQEAERDYGEAWLPDRDDDHPRTLVGTVIGYNQGPESAFTGENPWICAVTDRDGKPWSVWLNRAVLVSEFERHRPMPGERVAIRYRGVQDEPSRQGGAPAHLYRVTVDRDQQLPEFLIRPRLEGGQDTPDVPIDTGDVPTVPPSSDADVPDADVIEEGGDDDSIPF